MRRLGAWRMRSLRRGAGGGMSEAGGSGGGAGGARGASGAWAAVGGAALGGASLALHYGPRFVPSQGPYPVLV